jgi:xanthine/uracil/vitamin C permease (AzgA family)
MENMIECLSQLPDWFLALIVVLVGWLFAFVARFGAARILTALHFNQLCERTGTCEFLRKGEVGFSAAQLVGRGIYWLVLVAVLLEAARLLDIGVVTEFRRRVVSSLPAILSAVMVFVVGLILVAFLAGFVRTVTRNAGSPYANLWSRMTRWVGLVLVLAIALEQAEIRGSILAGVIQILFGAFAFGAALAFGLGCKDMARNAMEKLITDVKERHRDISKSDMEG